METRVIFLCHFQCLDLSLGSLLVSYYLPIKLFRMTFLVRFSSPFSILPSLSVHTSKNVCVVLDVVAHSCSLSYLGD